MAIKLAKEEKKPSAIFHINRANAYFELMRYNECLGDCTAAKEIDPNYAKLYWRVAKVMEALDKQDTAVGVLKGAIDKNCFSLDDKTNAFTKFYN
jgi:tetratricopeptide (TPR) repeat protein